MRKNEKFLHRASLSEKVQDPERERTKLFEKERTRIERVYP